MLDPKHFTVIAGQDIVDEIRAARARFNVDFDLIAHQRGLAFHGYRGAELVETAYGHWTARYDSGLQDFGVLLTRCSWPEALAWAEKWHGEDPTHRYVWRRK